MTASRGPDREAGGRVRVPWTQSTWPLGMALPRCWVVANKPPDPPAGTCEVWGAPWVGLPSPACLCWAPWSQSEGTRMSRGDLPRHGTEKGPNRGTDPASRSESSVGRQRADAVGVTARPSGGVVTSPRSPCQVTHPFYVRQHPSVFRTGVEARCQGSVTGDRAEVHLALF